MSQIPRIIHYIWFGHGPKPELLQKCIASWEKYLPDWEIKEWNESNFDISVCAYAQEAYDAKKYAFASDYARFEILYQYGGVYLDTDVELLKPIPDELLELKGFAGMESNNMVAPGLIFASIPRHPIVKEILQFYHSVHFTDSGVNKTIVDFTTEIFERYGFQRCARIQNVADFRIFPTEYFCGFDLDVKEELVTENTISIHHYACTWASPKSAKIKNFKMQIKKLVGVENYRKLLRIKRAFFGISK